ncbi:hypothetical protein H0H92_015082 [Tricholoma furcatifolium]|nr:hypothetical protein H0H92_015082 [Tricholoma furcatifolium]
MTPILKALRFFRPASTTFRSTPAGVANIIKQTLEAEKLRDTPFANAPGWNEALASESEADVKADRSEHPASTVELQEQTIEYVTSRYNPDDSRGPASTNAPYSREELRGPLSHAPGHEDTQEVYQTVTRRVSKKTTVVEEESK